MFNLLQISVLAACALVSAVSNGLTINEQAPDITLSGDDGGYIVDDKAFKLSDLKGKLNVIWYVDPDEKELNETAQEALRAAKFPLDKVGSIAIVNFAATIIPNWILGGVVSDSQEKNKNTTYIKDLNKVLVKKWNLKDDSSNVIILSKDLKVLYWFGGKLDKKETDTMLETVRKNM